MKISLKTKIMIRFIILIIAPMFILGVISYNMAAKALESSMKKQVDIESSENAKLINRQINLAKSVAKNVSLNKEISLLEKSSDESYKDSVFEYIGDVKNQNSAIIEDIIITDSNGKVILNSSSKNPDIDLSDRDYIKETLSDKKESISGVLVSRSTNNSSICISYPLSNNGSVIGTIVADIKFSSLADYISDVKIGEKGYICILDDKGNIVYHPDQDLGSDKKISDLGDSNLESMYDLAENQNEAQGLYMYEKNKKYCSFHVADNLCICVTADYNECMKAATEIRNNTIGISLVAIIIALIWAYFYSVKGIINPLKKLKKAMVLAGQGDLTVKTETKNEDEIGELEREFNDMLCNIEDIVRNVEGASKQLTKASEDLSSSSQEISATTEEIDAAITNVANDSETQNKSVVNVSEILVQLSSLVQLAKNRAESANKNVLESKDVASLGREKVQETVSAIDGIKNESKETSKALFAVSDLSKEANGIVTTINDIADQTSLLALNASIEAARAGEHGKGFSVVAEEIRKLSEESNDKAKAISDLINRMTNETKNAVSCMERANKKVENGVNIVSETDKAFLNILKAIENIIEHISGILDITNDEVASSDKIVKTINEVATISENNSANCENVATAINQEVEAVENLTSTAEETSAMSEELLKLVEKFKYEVK
ncbi:methyl-accepting chemotaxis protein [Clostridium sp. BJN0001]|uniref:methyl-accepting chemotaxis protein n=1 Tax=Clostridium sp. BJN0001 TaxID=2930219 RepID=UPI001FD3926F|nr:methyl-accepting chemotaxis protein [Clostridium sp. BJN0001]